MAVTLMPAYDRPEEVRTLFSEYTELLIANDPAFRDYLSVQRYDDELAHLEKKYGLPEGRLYLAYDADALAGCIGLKKIDAERCEMKRLYVRPQFRGRKLSERMIQQIIQDARTIGYQKMLLDTLPFLKSALHLYQKYGFYQVERYNDSPMDHSIYMQLDL